MHTNLVEEGKKRVEELESEPGIYVGRSRVSVRLK
jgi:hypothetical protein